MKTSINIIMASILALSLFILVYIVVSNRSVTSERLTAVYNTSVTGPGQALPYPAPSLTPGPVRTMPPTRIPPTSIPIPTGTPLPPSDPLDTPEVREIIAVIELGYELRSIAARTFDTSEFHTVFIDEAGVDLTPEQTAYVQRVAPHVRDRLTIGPKVGLLTYWKIQYAYWQLGAERLDRQLAGTPVSSQDGPIGPPRRTDPVLKTDLRFDNIRVNRDRAEVVLDDGLTLRRLHLLKTTEGWRIAQEIALKVHF